MSTSVYKKTYTNKKGEVKVYEYAHDWRKYEPKVKKKRVSVKKENQPKEECSICGKTVYCHYMSIHITKNICKKQQVDKYIQSLEEKLKMLTDQIALTNETK